MKRIWMKKIGSFKEAQDFDEEYYFSLSRAERLEIVQFLRETYRKFRRGKCENRKGLRGFIKVVQ